MNGWMNGWMNEYKMAALCFSQWAKSPKNSLKECVFEYTTTNWLFRRFCSLGLKKQIIDPLFQAQNLSFNVGTKRVLSRKKKRFYNLLCPCVVSGRLFLRRVQRRIYNNCVGEQNINYLLRKTNVQEILYLLGGLKT